MSRVLIPSAPGTARLSGSRGYTRGVTTLVLLFAWTAAANAASRSITNYFYGKDPRRWITTYSDSSADDSPKTLLDPAPYSVYLAGTRNFQAVKIAVDSQGNVYVGGNVFWPNPAVPGTLTGDVFVSKLDTAGKVLYTTYFNGGSLADLAVDPAGRVYLAGTTTSPDLPVVNAVRSELQGASDAFVCQLGSTGGFQYSTYLGGKRPDVAYAIAVDAAGNAYLTGATQSPEFPVTPGAFQTRPVQPNSFQSPANAFVVKLSPAGRIVYSTLLGGTRVACSGGSRCLPAAPYDAGTAVAVDSQGNAYVAGRTNSLDFPITSGALRSSCNCVWTNGTGFVTGLNPSGASLLFSTYFGGAPATEFTPGASITSIAAGPSGRLYLTGSTPPEAFPTTPGAFRPEPAPLARRSAQPVAFASMLSATGGLVYSTFLSGNGNETGNGIRVDADGNAYVTGTTQAADFPLTPGAFNRGSNFFLKLTPNGSALPFSTLLPAGVGGQALALDPSGSVYLLGGAGYVSRVPGPPYRLPAILGVANAARGRVGGTLSPGELFTIFGTGIGPDQPAGSQLDPNGRVSTSLAGTQVLVNETPAPLLYAQNDQINAVAPFGLPLSSPSLSVRVVRNGAEVGQFRVWPALADPAVFPVALNEDGTLNSPLNPAKYGSIVVVFATGLGPTEEAGVDGEIPRTRLPKPRLPLSLRSDLHPQLEILYAGQAPGAVAGLFQINFRLPTSLLGYPFPVTLQVGDFSTGLSLFVAP